MAKGKKSKGKGLKKKVKKEKKPEEEKKNLYDIPEYIDPKIYTPEVELTIRLASPPVEHLKFTMKARVTMRIEDIKRKIIDQHDGSIKDVTICLGRYTKEEILDPKKKLCEVGITTAGQYLMIYDFVPVSYPLLTTSVE